MEEAGLKKAFFRQRGKTLDEREMERDRKGERERGRNTHVGIVYRKYRVSRIAFP